MTTQQERREQISVPINRELRQAIERVAEAQHRTVAGQIRHWIASGLNHDMAERVTA
jgi:hypothetical protein